LKGGAGYSEVCGGNIMCGGVWLEWSGTLAELREDEADRMDIEDHLHQ